MVTTPRLILELRYPDNKRIASEIPKHTWIDLYADLYRQTHRESATALEILENAQHRIATLTANGLL